MKQLNTFVLGLLALATITATGCSLCCSPYTDDYVTFGSKRPRVDMKHGRVGSILSDPQAMDPIQSVQTGIEYGGAFETDSMEIVKPDSISLGSKRSSQ